MSASWLAALGALFAWWFSTGAILWAVRAAERSGRLAGLAALCLPLLAAGALGLVLSRDDPGEAGVTMAFLSALAVWGWIELAFLSGAITGPAAIPAPERARGWARFRAAWGTIAWHELTLAASLLLLLQLAGGAPNPWGLLTFAMLFAARISAKLNLFLGVPRINLEFLPRPLAHLESHFRRSRPSRLFPVSITLLTLATGGWLERLIATDDPAARVGYALLATLTALALLEHWLMVLPLPDAKLWRWMLPAPKPEPEGK